MKLNNNGVQNRAQWEKAGYHLPEFERSTVISRTHDKPFWIHFGAGNIFRAFQANTVQNLLNRGVIECGVIAVEGYDYEIIERVLHPHDNYSILATLKTDGTVEKTVIGSITESLSVDASDIVSYKRLKEIFRSPSLQMATFTITEKGYALSNNTGHTPADILRDYEHGPANPISYMGKVTALLYERYLAGKMPLAMVSMDNCSHNGDKLKSAILSFAENWEKRGLVSSGFCSYTTSGAVSFPWTMIDKITPRPNQCVEKLLTEDGVEDIAPLVTEKNSFTAPFVNAEECEYLVIEDSFPNGRPPLEKGGFIFTDRETVDKVERMKVCTCLNPLHTALAIFGCLLGYKTISEEIRNPVLKKLAERIGYQEGLPAVTDPGIMDPRKFIDTVINIRLPNPFMPDTPQRIATDTSQKLPIRFGETIKAYAGSPLLKLSDLKMIPLVFAGWLRYLLAFDDSGNAFVPSPDPNLDSLTPQLEGLTYENADRSAEILRPLLSDAGIFGVDLYETGLAPLVIKYFTEMCRGAGSVRAVLEKYVN